MKRRTPESAIPLLLSALMLSACGGIIPEGRAPTGAMSTATSSVSGPSTTISLPAVSRVSTAPAQVSTRDGEMACISELSATGAQFNALPDTYAAPGCHKLGTVQLSALSGDRGRFGISNIGPLKCEAANTFSGWVQYGVDRAAKQILGSPLKRVETMGSYSCRNVAGTKRRSAHARAEAIDVSGFVLEDGRRIVLEEDWSGGTAAEREFLRVVHKSACKRFGTVIGPAYNADHEDHFHLEQSDAKFCR
ncbi:MAG: extensin family protein [Pseudomonadota bacterium]